MSCKDKLLRLRSFLQANPQLAIDAEYLKTIDELLSGRYVIVPLEEISNNIAIADRNEGQAGSTRTMTFAAHSKVFVNSRFLKTRSNKINKMLFETLIKTLEDEKEKKENGN